MSSDDVLTILFVLPFCALLIIAVLLFGDVDEFERRVDNADGSEWPMIRAASAVTWVLLGASWFGVVQMLT